MTHVFEQQEEELKEEGKKKRPGLTQVRNLKPAERCVCFLCFPLMELRASLFLVNFNTLFPI
jgi:hypothetical protein